MQSFLSYQSSFKMMDDDASEQPSLSDRVNAQLGRRYQHLLDKSTVYIKTRWVSLLFLVLLYSVRVYFGQGWYIIDPETEGPLLPSKKEESDEFRPFSRKLPEFKFWHSLTRATVISILLTITRATDIPVFWPILVIYFFLLFFITMRRQIAHMIKHRYIPFSFGKQRYAGKDQLNLP